MSYKKRHGCLATYLIFLLVVNSALVLFMISLVDSPMQEALELPSSVLWFAMLGAVFNIVCTVALFHWKKWGFIGFAAVVGVLFVWNVASGVDVLRTLSGPAGLLMLYGVLQIGKENKGWPQLE